MQNTRGTRGIIHNPGYLLTPCSRALVFGKHATPGGNFFFLGKGKGQGQGRYNRSGQE